MRLICEESLTYLGPSHDGAGSHLCDSCLLLKSCILLSFTYSLDGPLCMKKVLGCESQLGPTGVKYSSHFSELLPAFEIIQIVSLIYKLFCHRIDVIMHLSFKIM